MGQLRTQAAAISSGERSSVDTVAAALEAAARLQPSLNAFTMLFEEDALARAENVDRERRSSLPHEPLRGVPVAVKDLYDVAGFVTSGCSRPYMTRSAATADAHATAALRRSGAIIIGKTNMHELAFGATNSISSYGPANNPWDPDRMPGGSSGGSAAVVAARIVGLALGSDTGGSIRIPASFCGATGLKTTAGLLSLAGVLPMSPSLDTTGVIASDAEDAALAFAVLAGEPGSGVPALEGTLRIGIASGPFYAEVDAEVGDAVLEGARVLAGAAGAELVECSTPWAEAARAAWLDVALAEFVRAHDVLAERTEELDPTIAVIFHAGRSVTAEKEAESRERGRAAREEFSEQMRTLDAIVMPGTPFAAPRHEDQIMNVGSAELPVHLGGPSHYTRPASAIGAPAIALPCAFSAGGLPIGMQVVATHGAEKLLLALAAFYQNETGWHERAPALRA